MSAIFEAVSLSKVLASMTRSSPGFSLLAILRAISAMPSETAVPAPALVPIMALVKAKTLDHLDRAFLKSFSLKKAFTAALYSLAEATRSG